MASLFGATVLSTTELAPGITKEVTRAPPADASSTLPQVGQDCFVHYTGKLENGEVFDSSVTRGRPFQFKVGIGSVIKAWDVGVLSMAIGEKCVLTCSFENAYGAAGMPPVIPPKATLVFEVELLSIGARPEGMAEESWCTVA
jgi:FKBP-type peptidyl-prolyl cis-trans isomerase